MVLVFPIAMSKQFERQELHIMKVSRLVQGMDDDKEGPGAGAGDRGAYENHVFL